MIKAYNLPVKLLFAVCGLVLILSGCISIKGSSSTAKSQIGPLGVYKSEDGGNSWKVKNDVLNVGGQKLTINELNIDKIVFDPFINPETNYRTLYALTSKGLYVSYNSGDAWEKIAMFKDFVVNDVAVSYFDKCNVFVTAGQSIYRTTDCARTWQEVYFDRSNTELQMVEVETEDYNRSVLYASTNKGDILKSVDNGMTWKIIKRLNVDVRQILIDKDDTRVLYFLTKNKGIYKTTDGGQTWSNEKKETDLNENLGTFKDAKVGYYLVQDMTQKNTLLLACKYGILRSSDGGMNWQSLSLITAPGTTIIYSLAIDPKDNMKIMYGTENTIYKSVDSGKTWATQKSPGTHIINFLIYDPKDSKIIYLGNQKLIKK